MFWSPSRVVLESPSFFGEDLTAIQRRFLYIAPPQGCSDPVPRDRHSPVDGVGLRPNLGPDADGERYQVVLSTIKREQVAGRRRASAIARHSENSGIYRFIRYELFIAK